MNKIDPQKSANEVIAALAHKMKLKGRMLWRMVGDLGLLLEKSLRGDDMIDPKQGSPAGAKKPSKRVRADLYKMAAILQDIAEQHKALERFPEDDPENNILKER